MAETTETGTSQTDENQEEVKDPTGLFPNAKFKGSFPAPGSESKDKPADPPATPDPATPAAPAPAAASTPATAPAPESPYKRISELVGEEISSDDQLVGIFKSRRDLETQLTQSKQKITELEGIDPLAKDIDKAVKSGLDVNLYLEARQMEPEKMDQKDALRKKYVLDNSSVYAVDREFVLQKFEREYTAKYGILSEKLTAEEQEEKAQELDFVKRSLNADVILAKKSLTEWKSKNVAIPEAKPQDPAAQQQFVERFYKEADDFIDSLEHLDVPVGDKEFKFGLEDFREEIRKDLKNPVETLKRLGLDVNGGGFDPVKFGETLVKLRAVDALGSKLSDWVLEQRNTETLARQLGSPPPTQPLAGGAPPPEKTHDEKVGLAFKNKWEGERQGD